MKFQNPQLLYALFVLAIPIIIHLFNLRKYKTIRFSSIRLLKEIKQAKRARSNLKNILILLSRLFALTFIILAFAGPYIPKERETIEHTRDIFFYIDNSFSMDAKGENGILLDLTKQQAKRISDYYGIETNFYLITNDFFTKHTRSLNKDEISQMIDQINSSPYFRTFSEILSRQQTLNKHNNQSRLYIFTDLQKSTLDLEKITDIDSNISILIIPQIANNASNLYIDSCWTNSPIIQKKKPMSILARVINKSEDNLNNIPAYLYINSTQKSISNFSVSAQDENIISFSFSPLSNGLKEGEIKIQDYPISFDDNFFFSFEITEKIQVMNIYNENPNIQLKTLFENDVTINYQSIPASKLNYQDITNQQFVIFDGLTDISTGLIQSISTFVKDGGTLGIIPNNNINYKNYNQLCLELKLDKYLSIDTTKYDVKKINYSHKLFYQVFDEEENKINLPIVFKHFGISTNNTSKKESVFSLENGDDFISHYTFFNGDVYLFSSSLDKSSTNFGNHALFVPSLYNMALMSFHNKRLYYTIGKNLYFDVPYTESNSGIYHLKSKNYDIIPLEIFLANKKQLFLPEQLKEAANYKLITDNKTISSLSFNYNRKESNPLTYSIQEVQEILVKQKINNIQITNHQSQNINSIVQAIQLGESYWKLCVIFALIFLMIEILLIKFIK